MPARAEVLRARLAALTTRAVKGPLLGALAVRVSGAVLSLVTTLLIARLGGAAVAGLYGLASQTAQTLATLAVAGADYIVVRAVAGDLREGRTDLAWGAVRQSRSFVLWRTVVLALVLLAASPWAATIGATVETLVLAAAFFIWVPIVRMYAAVLRAAHRPRLSQVIDGPIASLVLTIGLLVFAVTGLRVEIVPVMLILIGGAILAAILASLIIARLTADWPRAQATRFASVEREGRPQLLAMGAQMISLWLVLAITGALAGAAEVGAFRVALQIVTIIALLMTTLEQIYLPSYAGDIRTAGYGASLKRHQRGTLTMGVVTLPPIVACFVFAPLILSIFGPEFDVATTAVRILLAGQIVNVLTGPIGGVLYASGRDHVLMGLSFLSLAVTALGALLFVPHYGINAAATAYSAGLALRNLLALLLAYRYPPRDGGVKEQV